MDRLTEDVGGNNNASTGGDLTNYFEIVPSNYLQTLLWAEADRMSNLKVADKNFKSEREVVKEECRQRVLADPYGKLFNSIDAHSYVAHPYKRPTIGNIEELDAASLQDVIDFHKTFYRPDNATLIVTGDFDPNQLDAWVDRYFGWIPKPASAIPQVAPIEPARSQDKRYTETSETAPLPGLAMTWLIPPASDPDYIPLQVAGGLLSQGDSSRLYQSLVYQHQVAQQVGAFADGRVGTGLFTAYTILASGHTPDEAETLLRAEISRLVTQPIPADELDKIRHAAADRPAQAAPDRAGHRLCDRPGGADRRRSGARQQRPRCVAGRHRRRRAARAAQVRDRCAQRHHRLPAAGQVRRIRRQGRSEMKRVHPVLRVTLLSLALAFAGGAIAASPADFRSRHRRPRSHRG